MNDIFTDLTGISVRGRIRSSEQGLLIGSTSQMPNAEGNEGLAVLYTGPTQGELVSNTLYVSNGTTWKISAGKSELEIDPLPMKDSTNPVASGGVYANYATKKELQDGLTEAAVSIDIDPVPREDSPNPVASGGVYTALDGKVSIEIGKGLSTNDFTTPDKNKLSGIANGAQVNVIETILVNSIAQTPSGKSVNIDLSNYATRQELSSIPKFTISVVTSLPTSNISTTTIYLMSNRESSGQNIYDEYIYVNSKWEKIGSTEPDLSGYVTEDNAISSLSASGSTITYYKANGTSGTITVSGGGSSEPSTDENVLQNNTTGSSAFPILLKNGTGTGSITGPVQFNSGVTVKPSDGTVTATKFVGALEGNASSATKAITADSAVKATQDGDGNTISLAYATTGRVGTIEANVNQVKTDLSQVKTDISSIQSSIDEKADASNLTQTLKSKAYTALEVEDSFKYTIMNKNGIMFVNGNGNIAEVGLSASGDVMIGTEEIALRKDIQTALDTKQDPILAGTGISIGADGKTIGHSNSISPQISLIGGATAIPQITYDSEGHITGSSTVAVYPPTTAGSSGQIWVSNGSGVGRWGDPSSISASDINAVYLATAPLGEDSSSATSASGTQSYYTATFTGGNWKRGFITNYNGLLRSMNIETYGLYIGRMVSSGGSATVTGKISAKEMADKMLELLGDSISSSYTAYSSITLKGSLFAISDYDEYLSDPSDRVVGKVSSSSGVNVTFSYNGSSWSHNVTSTSTNMYIFSEYWGVAFVLDADGMLATPVLTF